MSLNQSSSTMSDVVLAEMRAGKMLQDGKLVRPDKRKGLVRVVRSDDGLLHVHWLERTASGPAAAPEDDVIVFPGEAALEKVPNQRVFVLRFGTEPDRDMLFWLQEPDAGADDGMRRKFDGLINGHEDMEEELALAATNTATLQQSSSVQDVNAVPSSSVGHNIGDVTQVLGQAGGQTAASDLARLLSSMASQGPNAAAFDPSIAAALLAQMAGQREHHVSRPTLAEVLKPETIAPLMSSQEMLNRVSQYLPEEHRSVAALEALVHSPQFHQQVSAFSSALAAGQLDLQQFGLQPKGFSTIEFLQAIQDLVDTELVRQDGASRSEHGDGQQPMQ